MNKYTKNMLWFNIEKLITLIVVLGFITLMAFTLSSCNTSTHLCDKYSTPKTTYECPLFTN